MDIRQSQTTHVSPNYVLFWRISKRTLALKLFLWLYYLLQVDKGYIVRKANEQAIKQKIVTLYDQVFIQQSILEVRLRFFFGTPCRAC